MTRADPISLLYDAAIGEAEWVGALEAVSENFACAALFLGIGDPRDPATLDYWHVNTDVEAHIASGIDPAMLWDPRVNLAVRVGLTMRVGRAMPLQAFIPRDVLFRNDFLQTTMVKPGFMRSRLFVPLRGHDLLAGGFIARLDGNEIEGVAAGQLDQLVPHIGRALRLRNEFGRHRGIETSLQSALDSLSTGVLVIDLDLRILIANAHADALLAANDGLTSTRGRLAVAKPVRDRFLTAVRGTHRRNGATPASAIPAPRPSGRSPYLLRVFPAIGTVNLAGAGAGCATVTIHDPAAPAALPEPTELSDALGLTPAEAAVARLVPLAESKRVMAERLGVSENTVKTHLTAIRAKLDVQNATELARVVQAATVIGRPYGPSR